MAKWYEQAGGDWWMLCRAQLFLNCRRVDALSNASQTWVAKCCRMIQIARRCNSRTREFRIDKFFADDLLQAKVKANAATCSFLYFGSSELKIAMTLVECALKNRQPGCVPLNETQTSAACADLEREKETRHPGARAEERCMKRATAGRHFTAQ